MKHFRNNQLCAKLHRNFVNLIFLLSSILAEEEYFLNTLKVVNINIWSGLNYEGIFTMGEFEDGDTFQNRYTVLIDQLRSLNADVITMQEVNPLPSRAKQIAEDLDMDVIYHVSEAGIQVGCIGVPINLRQGDAIFARKNLDLEWVGRHRLTGGYAGNVFAFHFDDGAQVLAGKIQYKGESIHIFTTHWHASVPDLPRYHKLAEEHASKRGFGEEKVNELKELLISRAEWRITEAKGTTAYIKEICNDSLPFILTGDFNSTTEMEEMHILNSLPIIDAFMEFHSGSQGITWDADNNSNVILQYPEKSDFDMHNLYDLLDYHFNRESYRIDYIFYHPGRNDLKASSSSVVLNTPQNGVFPSDHYGVLTEFKLK